jgi:hypothetical protein
MAHLNGGAMRDPVALDSAIQPVLLVISGNAALLRLIRKAAKGKLEVVVRNWTVPDRELLCRRKPKLVVFDDTLVDRGERIWMLTQIKRFTPEANVMYVAAEHTPELERRARALGVACYGPLDDARLYAFAKKLCAQFSGVSESPFL